ncbi:hypothetical protein JHK87_050024 [Glycine soja]|nr:hypothetical protein JHK87_050024 [Glycine soja]
MNPKDVGLLCPVINQEANLASCNEPKERWSLVFSVCNQEDLILKIVTKSRIMARIPDKIKDINGSKETLKLAMRITNLWFVGTPDKSEQDEMVIVDSDGDEIHVVCKMDLKENCTYVMHSFKVIKNDGQYRVCDHQYKLAFIGVTVVSQSDLDGLPFKKFKFSEFANVITGRFKPDLLVGIKVRSVLTPRGQGSSQLSGSTQLSSKDASFSKAEAKSISKINNISEDGDIDLNASLEVLNKLLGYVLAFKVKVQPKFRNVVVLKYSSDLSLINTVMDLLPDAEASSKIHIPILDSNDPPQHESQSLSRTADHDPLLGLPLTPTKQQTSPECDDEARSSQISLAQLSSNK